MALSKEDLVEYIFKMVEKAQGKKQLKAMDIQKAVLKELQPKMATIPSASAVIFSPPSLPGSPGGPPIQFVITTTGDFRQLARVTDELAQAAKASGLFIFTDTDLPNWAWDPVSKSYYWHRFFSHQPDLNFDNPAVLEAVWEIMKFWLDMGVDGLRLEAVH